MSGRNMTSFGLFSVNQHPSHPHVSRTNFATALDAQDRLQKQHNPDAFKAAHPSGRLGRLLNTVPGANTSGLDTDEEPSPELSSTERHTLPEAHAQEAGVSSIGGPFIPIQPKQRHFPFMAAPVSAPVAQMFPPGPHQSILMPSGAASNPSHGAPRLLTHSAETRQQQAPYLSLHPNLTNQPNSLHAPQVPQFPSWGAGDASAPLKRKRGRPRRVDPKNVIAAPLRPYPPPTLAVHAAHSQIFAQPKAPPPFYQHSPLLAQSRDSFQPHPSSSIEGLALQPEDHDDDTALKRKRGRPRKSDIGNPGGGRPTPLIPRGAIPDSRAQNGFLPNSHTFHKDVPQDSRAQEGFQSHQIQLGEGDAAAAQVSQPQNLHIPATAQGKGRAAALNLGYMTLPRSNPNSTDEQATQAAQSQGLTQAESQKKPRGRPKISATNGGVTALLPSPPPPEAQDVPQGGVWSGPLHLPSEHGLESQPYNDGNSMKKPRGRPRKSDLSNPVAAPSPPATPTSEVQKGPRVTQIKQTVPPKRSLPEKRGPFVSQPENEDLSLPQKKPRGRPRKSDSNAGAAPLTAPSPKEPDGLLQVSQLNLNQQGEHGPDISHFPNDDAVTPQKRPRGRPRKHEPSIVVLPFSPEPEHSPQIPQPSQPPPEDHLPQGHMLRNHDISTSQKKPRGRPRRSDLNEITVASSVTPEQGHAPRVYSFQERGVPNQFPPEGHPSLVSRSQDNDASMPLKKRPGRPRKLSAANGTAALPPANESSPEQFVSVSPPQQSPLRETSAQFKRKRGRPSKAEMGQRNAEQKSPDQPSLLPKNGVPEVGQSTDPSSSIPLKRKRGRPSKADFLESTSVQAEESVSRTIAIAPKTVVIQSQEVDVSAPAPVPEKRKPGRPKKMKTTNPGSLGEPQTCIVC